MSKATLILKNGHIFSIDAEGRRISGEAVAAENDRIIFVGDSDEAMAFADDRTVIIDCEGNSILPGMCDVHCHPSIAGSVASACDLFGVYRDENQSAGDIIKEYQERLKTYIDEHPDAELVRGTGWVESNFLGEGELPTRHDIDEICSDRPVILEAFSQHNIWVNTKAIEIAGVDARTPDPSIGRIHREEDGFPSGVFNDPEAMDLIKTGVPGYDLSVDEYKEAFLWYQRECANRYGVTMVQDCLHSDNAREAYRQLAEEGRLTVYLRGVYLLEPDKYEDQIEEIIRRKGKDNVGRDFRIDTMKLFAEGQFAMIDPYEPGFCEEIGVPSDYNGPLYWADDVFVENAAKAMEAGLQVHVHAMGDLSVRQSVDCLARAQARTGRDDLRNVVAHLMLVPNESAVKMGENNIMGNCQPRWMVYDGDIYGMIPMIGKTRSESAYPYRKLLDSGVRVAFGTDYPVTPPPDTMHEIQCAMTRTVFPEAPDYEKYRGCVLGKERPAALGEAIESLTINGAYQIFAEKFTGSIEEGKSAELVILDRNIEETPAEEISVIRVRKTIFKGRVVYDKYSE